MLSMQLSFRKLLGEVYAFEVAFLQKAFSSASTGYFCPLRYRVTVSHNLCKLGIVIIVVLYGYHIMFCSHFQNGADPKYKDF